MNKLRYSIHIDAAREKVWSTMLDDASYRKWTSAFAEGSHYRGSWDEGEKLLFLDASGAAGMVSTVRENRVHEWILLEHLGIVKDGVEDTKSEEAMKWAPAFESYRLIEQSGGTLLEIEMDAASEMQDYFDETWPEALQRLKGLAEA